MFYIHKTLPASTVGKPLIFLPRIRQSFEKLLLTQTSEIFCLIVQGQQIFLYSLTNQEVHGLSTIDKPSDTGWTRWIIGPFLSFSKIVEDQPSWTYGRALRAWQSGVSFFPLHPVGTLRITIKRVEGDKLFPRCKKQLNFLLKPTILLKFL